MGEWDNLSKKIIQHNPQAFINLFWPGARVITTKPPALEDADLEMDNLILTETAKRKLILVNIEVQTYNNLKMPHRLLGYNIATWIKYEYQYPVSSCVIYLLRKGKKPVSPFILKIGDDEEIIFPFRSIEFGKWTTKDLLAKEDIELLPFFPLTKGGLERKHLEAVLDQLYELEDKHLVGVTYTMASLAYLHYQKKEPDWFIRKRSVMGQEWVREIPIIREAIQFGMEEGIEKGIEKGLAQGLQKGRQEGLEQGLEKGRQEELALLREILFSLVKGRFPSLTPQAKTQASHIKTPETLKNMVTRVGLATTLEEAQQALHEEDPPSEKRQ